MRIDGPGGPKAAGNVTKKDLKKARASDSGFGALIDGASDTAESAPTQQVTHVSSMDAVLLAQTVDEKALKQEQLDHGDRLLSLLENLRTGLITGRLSPQTVHRLAEELKQKYHTVIDPELTEILREIETRTAVELAKLERK